MKSSWLKEKRYVTFVYLCLPNVPFVYIVVVPLYLLSVVRFCFVIIRRGWFAVALPTVLNIC